MTPLNRVTPIVTLELVRDFQRLARVTCGVQLSDQEAWERATELVTLFRMFVGPLPEDEEGADVQTSSDLPN